MKKLSLETLQNKIITYQVIVLISFMFGIVGFVYNNNIRIENFQILHELSFLE